LKKKRTAVFASTFRLDTAFWSCAEELETDKKESKHIMDNGILMNDKKDFIGRSMMSSRTNEILV
jgi:hypothetical protein